MKKSKKFIIVAAVLFLLFLGYKFYFLPLMFPFDKEIKAYVMDNLTPIESVDPNELNFQDLNVLKEAIGEASFVLLGEQDHGDAPTFLAKTRIIKFLRKKMGFDVLIFESDFYGINQTWDLAKAGEGSLEEYRNNIYPLWANCAECADLFQYIDANFNTSNEITVSGADPIHSLSYSSENLLPDLKRLIDDENLIEETEDQELFYSIVSNLLTQQYGSDITGEQQEFFHSTLSHMSQRLEKDSFWHQELRNMNSFALNAWDEFRSNNSRDIQMGENLMWLMKYKFPGRKIIFWGSNSHIFKDFSQIAYYQRHRGGKDTVNTGTYLHPLLQEDLYVLGFTSYQGQAGRLYGDKYEVNKPLPHNFESWLAASGHPYAFVNFRDAPFREDNARKFWMKALIHQPSLVNWFRMFDGIFYIEEMYPCTEIDRRVEAEGMADSY